MIRCPRVVHISERREVSEMAKTVYYRSMFLLVAVATSARAGLITGTVTLDGNTIQYQAYSGTDASAFAAFLQGAQFG